MLSDSDFPSDYVPAVCRAQGGAAPFASQINDIADAKDFGKIFLDGAVKVAERVKAMIDAALVDADKLKNQTIPSLAKNVKIVEDQRRQPRSRELRPT